MTDCRPPRWVAAPKIPTHTHAYPYVYVPGRSFKALKLSCRRHGLGYTIFYVRVVFANDIGEGPRENKQTEKK